MTCGIVCIYDLTGKPVWGQLPKKMLDTVKHRGPDDEGYLFVNTMKGDYFAIGGEDTPESVFRSHFLYSPTRRNDDADIKEKCNLVFGHRRLSIIDLSPAGHQPMCNENGTLWIIHNGEVYNYQELRADLIKRGHEFCSYTDTEVILHAYEEWGVNCLEKFNGMWAFAIWDSKNRRLFGARDRFGVKPFYYYFDGIRVLIASEIKAILADETVKKKPNDQMIYDYLVYGYLDHTENTFFGGIKQLRPAHYLCIEKSEMKIDKYWDLEPNNTLGQVDDQDSARKFREIFEDSIRLRLRSDVPVGTCLSGGLDSSSIVCVINGLLAQNKHLQKTFSACSEVKKHDEREFICEVLKKTGADGHLVFPRGEELLNLIDEVIWHQDEPFPSTSTFAQWCVMRLAKENGVKVLLDGQGADEILGGYLGWIDSYIFDLLRSFEISKLAKEARGYGKHRSYSKLLRGLIYNFYVEFASRHAQSKWLDREFAKSYAKSPANMEFNRQKFKDYLHELLYQSLTNNLPKLLHQEDRNSMAFSIESRVPFLDYRLVEYMFSLPNDQKIRNGVTKIVLRNAMRGILPEKIRNRMDKIAFETPEAEWFRTILRSKVQEIIDSDSFRRRGYFDVDRIKREFKAHCEGKKDATGTIWKSVNLELWFRKFID